jgi:hypothetical protein
MEEPNILVKTALNEAVQKVNEGMTPSAALKKVANELDLNPNYIQRTGEALNVALHYKHFKTASDRSAEFEIADIPQVIQDVFSLPEKTAASYKSENFSVSDANETVFNYNRMLSNPMYKRAFLEIATAKETHESYPATFRTVYEKSANYIQKLNKTAEAAEVEKVAAEIDLNSSFSELCDEFRKDAGYRTAFEEFESQVFAKHGSAALPYIDLIHKTACAHEERGVHDSAYMMFETCKQAAMFDTLMSAASRMIEAEKIAAETAENLAFESSYLKEAHKLLGKKAEEEKEESEAHEKAETPEEEAAEEASEDPVLEEIKKKVSKANDVAFEDPVLKQAMEKEAFGGLGGFGKLLTDLVHTPITEAYSGMLKKPIAHGGGRPNLTLDNMERKLLLQELMMTDPILSKVNPAKVARAFEQIIRLSPEMSKEKEVVRAELRAMVSTQALSKYDAELMSKMDLGMLKRRVATQQFNKGETTSFRF